MNFFVLRHTQAGQETLGKLFAARYVERGARWLNHYAPKGWYRNCLNGGLSRIRTSYGNQGILTIAFEYCGQFADSTGYINEGKVLRGFGLWPNPIRCRRLGFSHGDYMPFKKYPYFKITKKMLDSAWAELLENPPPEWRMPYRHPTKLDRRYLESLHFGVESRFSFGLWLRNLFSLRRLRRVS